MAAAGPSGARVGADTKPRALSIPSTAVLSGFCKCWGQATSAVLAHGVGCCSLEKERPSPADLPPTCPSMPPCPFTPVEVTAPHRLAKGSPLKLRQKEQNTSDTRNVNPWLQRSEGLCILRVSPLSFKLLVLPAVPFISL